VDGTKVVGVYVPMRYTDSRLAVRFGGRRFPGVHRPALVEVRRARDRIEWRIESPSDGFHVDVRARIASDTPFEVHDPVGATSLGATVGVSPGRGTRLEAASMQLEHRLARTVEINELDSSFVSSFRTARAAPSYLLEEAHVDWTAMSAPRADWMGALRDLVENVEVEESA
jgi:hypothetical protein